MIQKLRLWEHNISEPSGKNIVALTVDDESPRAIRNVGSRNDRPDHWLEITRSQFETLFQKDSVEFVAFSKRAAQAVRNRDAGTSIARRKMIRDAAKSSVYD